MHLSTDNHIIDKILSSFLVNVLVIAFFALRFVQFSDIHAFAGNGRWQTYELAIDYSFGFVKRAILGSLVSILSDSFHLGFTNAVIVFMYIEEFFFTVAIFGVLVYVINRYKDPAMNLMILLYLSTNLVGFYYFDWGEPDIVLITLTIVACLLIIKDKYLWIIPVLLSICVMIHEAYVMMYFGLVMSLLLIRIVQCKNTSDKRRYISVLISTGLICSLLFVYFYYFSRYAFNSNLDVFLNKAASRVDFVDTTAANLSYAFWGVGAPSGAMWVEGVPTNSFWIRMSANAVTLIVMIPLLCYKVAFWKDIINSEDSRVKRVAYLLCANSVLLTLPLILIQTDQGRWFYDIVFTDFMMIVFCYLMNTEIVSKILNRVLKRSILNFLLFVAYLCIFSNPSKQLIDNLIGNIGAWVISL
ncbi:MAG: hypothetical protein K6C38_09960 [Saccharofermentans sp.]|nr:hypothetical protein [Saccharofermentans sp.]